jgi:hypothetical protein
VTCYMRHMDWLFEALHLPQDKVTRKRVDAALCGIVGVGDDGHCPEVWAGIKALTDDERSELPELVRRALGA